MLAPAVARLIEAFIFLLFTDFAFGQYDCSDKSSYPSIELPWGTYQATACDANGNFFVISNVRYGENPTGNLRFNVPQYPAAASDPTIFVDNSESVACYQVETDLSSCPRASSSLERKKKKFRPHEPFLGNPVNTVTQTEDCLFLDIYVPFSAFSSGGNTPVVVWFYGGAYLFGAKINPNPLDLPLYNGTGIMRAAHSAGSDIIFVTGNYRLGAFGWLAGSSMEYSASAGSAVPNVGLYDQRLILKFVQDFIQKVGGDTNQVSAWGESAGGGSILHHLVANWPTDPGNLYFQKTIVQSPAWAWEWDRTSTGMPEVAFQNLTEIANCQNTAPLDAIECLQGLNADDLATYNQNLFDLTKCTGVFSLGPAVDGKLISTLPAITFASGSLTNLESLIASHVYDESKLFIPAYAGSDTGYSTFLNAFLPLPKYAQAQEMITAQYASITNQKQRIANIIRDSSFTCNTRQVFNAYGSSAARYLMEYAYLYNYRLAIHASDLLPTFYNSDFDVAAAIKTLAEKYGHNLPSWLINWIAKYFQTFAGMYQTYFVSHAISGDPNTLRSTNNPNWPQGTPGAVFGTVLRPTFPTTFSLINDDINTAANCDFWQNTMAPYLMSLGQQNMNESNWSTEDNKPILFVQRPEEERPDDL